MQNVQKYFLILESLNFGENPIDADNKLKENLNILKKYLRCEDIRSNATLSQLFSQYSIADTWDEQWECACYLFHLILTIKSNINLDSTDKGDLISIRNQNELLNAIKLASRYGTVYNLPMVLQQNLIFKSHSGKTADSKRLKVSLSVISEMFTVVSIATNRTMDPVVLETMAGIYSSEDPQLIHILDLLWQQSPKENYFRYLLILKSINGLLKPTQDHLHRDLLAKLTEPGGFKLLVLNTVPAVSGSTGIPNWKRYEIVARIIAHKGHSNEFYSKMIDQIFRFIQNSLYDVMESSLIPAGIVTLRKLYMLDENLKNCIERKLHEMYKPLSEPDDVITGLVVMELSELQSLVKLQSTLFNGSSCESLPSAALTKYIPLLISLFTLTDSQEISQQLVVLVSRCLANREPNELQKVLNTVFNKKNNELNMQYLCDRIGVRSTNDPSQYQLQIMPSDFDNHIDLPAGLIKIIKTCNNNILAYNCFVQILTIFDEVENTINKSDSEADLLQTEEELEKFLARKFETRISVISCLTDLIAFRQFHSQFHENPGPVLDFLLNALRKRIDSSPNQTPHTDENLPILLAVFQELIENTKDCTKYREIRNSLQTYSKQVDNDDLKHQIQTVISLIDDGPGNSSGLGSCEYNFARSLLSESESHLRVYGITQFIKLLANRNEEAISNRHAILAMAMHALRDDESYTYLNCVRLFVSLMNLIQSEVLETLSAEYLNENETVEFRLKVGEAILKVTEELGPISYNYKDILINAFLHGARNKIDEYRASSLSNLASVCKLLSYQVHNFFNEMMLLIESTLQTDTYLPARRASVLVLSQLLWGMDNLIDFQETLLPIYRLLMTIVKNDEDEKTRIHATNGLTYLKDKCKAFLFPEQNLQKEIKIFGVKNEDESSRKKKTGHILEL